MYDTHFNPQIHAIWSTVALSHIIIFKVSVKFIIVCLTNKATTMYITKLVYMCGT